MPDHSNTASEIVKAIRKELEADAAALKGQEPRGCTLTSYRFGMADGLNRALKIARAHAARDAVSSFVASTTRVVKPPRR